MYLFGGYDNNVMFNDLYKIDLKECKRWIQLLPIGKLPKERCGCISFI